MKLAVFTLDLGMRFTMAKNHFFSLEPVLQIQYYPRYLRTAVQGPNDYTPPYYTFTNTNEFFVNIGVRFGFSF